MFLAIAKVLINFFLIEACYIYCKYIVKLVWKKITKLLTQKLYSNSTFIKYFISTCDVSYTIYL